jgi:hypothetical protein
MFCKIDVENKRILGLPIFYEIIILQIFTVPK